jgi:hypothetical protein
MPAFEVLLNPAAATVLFTVAAGDGDDVLVLTAVLKTIVDVNVLEIDGTDIAELVTELDDEAIVPRTKNPGLDNSASLGL